MSNKFLDRVWHRAGSLGKRVWDDWLTDDDRAAALGLATKGLQEGKRLVDESGAKLLSSLGLATQADVRRISHKVGRLRKKLQTFKIET